MRKTGIIVTTAIIFFLIGGMIIAWSVIRTRSGDQRAGVKVPITYLKSFTDENFEAEVIEASMKTVILVDFFAEWCFPCRMLDPVLEEIAKDFKGQAVLGKLDTDKNLIAKKLGVDKIPAIFIIRNGEIKNIFYGVVPKEALIKALKEYIS